MQTLNGKEYPNVIMEESNTDHKPEGYPTITLSVPEYDSLMEDRMTLRRLLMEAKGGV